MVKEIVNVDEVDLHGIGQVFHLSEATKYGEGWQSTISSEMIMDGACKIGLVHSVKLPVCIENMERHFTTKEAMIATTEEIVVAIASDTSNKKEDIPDVEDIVCILLKPGDVFLINKGVWHSACYGINKSTLYYFLYEDYNETVIWTKIKNGPCELK